jgi:hypothetical protein
MEMRIEVWRGGQECGHEGRDVETGTVVWR